MTAVLGVAEPYRPLLCKPPGTVDGTKFRRAELVVADHHTTVGLLPVQILGCGFFYLEVGVGALLPCTGPLVGDALPANPLIGHGRQYALVPAVVVKLLHRPGGEPEPQVLRAGSRHLDELSYLLACDGGDSAFRVGGTFEGGKAR